MSRLKKAGLGLTVAGSLAIGVVGAFEGMRTKAYRDVVGVPTVCFGETRGVKMGDEYTVEECKVMLGDALVEFETGMRRCLTAPDRIPDQAPGRNAGDARGDRRRDAAATTAKLSCWIGTSLRFQISQNSCGWTFASAHLSQPLSLTDPGSRALIDPPVRNPCCTSCPAGLRRAGLFFAKWDPLDSWRRLPLGPSHLPAVTEIPHWLQGAGRYDRRGFGSIHPPPHVPGPGPTPN